MTKKEPVWCIACEQRPAAGELHRIDVDGEDVTLVESSDSVPLLCEVCGKDNDGVGAKPARDGRPTYFIFEPFKPLDTLERRR